jgi:ribonuclease G
LLKFVRRALGIEEEPAPEQRPAPEDRKTERPPEGAQEARRKRRRGSRGGRGRRKAADKQQQTAQPAQATKEAEPAAKPERKPAAKPERKPAQPERRPAARQRTSSRRRLQPRRGALPAAKRELFVSVDIGEQRAAVLEDGQVAEVYLERPERRSITGNVYLGAVDNVLPGMEAAFIELGLEKNGFLYVDEIVVPELEGKRHGKKIQDLLSRGQTLLVQAVKDPMKSKGARLTTEISLPGRFVVFVPQGDGLGVSRRLPDDERNRLKEIVKRLDVPSGGLIVRTAAEGASEEDVERDLVFLQRLWKSIQARAKQAKAPTLLYQEAELPLRVVRDLFTDDFERLVVDHERTYKRIVGYLKKTSPHMVERVERWKEKPPLMEHFGVDAQVRSTLSRRVDLPSGGYLIFDYAEAFTVIDVNTGRFVGSRSKSSNGGLEDTITKNNLEAVREVVRQLRLRDIGGIIVIDFIDMANPKNRATVEEALRNELERDRTKTYVVEISPLGLVEMTRQNVTEGPREILTKPCPTCDGDGIVFSEASVAIDAERRLRALAAKSRSRGFRVELHPRVASIVIGPGASRLADLEAQTRRRFFLEAADGVPLDHFSVLAQGKVEELRPSAPVEEGAEVRIELVEVGLHDPTVGVGKLNGYDVCVADAGSLVGKRVKARIERVLPASAYATRVGAGREGPEPITAEAEAEKPTRRPPARKGAEAKEPVAEAPTTAEAKADEGEQPDRPKRRRRSKKAVEAAAAAPATEPEAAAPVGEPAPVPRIHVPAEEIGRDDGAAEGEPAPEVAPEAGAEEEEKPRKKTRRGTRGGRKRRKKTAAVAADGEDAVGAAETSEAESAPSPDGERAESPREPADAETALSSDGEGAEDGDWEYVPMSEWENEL